MSLNSKGNTPLEITPTTKPYEEITYFKWKRPTIIFFVLFILSLISTIFYLKLIVLNEVYDKYNICDPVFYFYGKDTSCKKFIENSKKKAIEEKDDLKLPNKRIDVSYIKLIIEKESFENANLAKLIIEETNNSSFFSFDIKETIDNNYLAMVEFIRSLKELFWASIITKIKQIML